MALGIDVLCIWSHGLICFGFFMTFFHIPYLSIIYSSLGAVLFSFYIIYDTQLIIGGKHKKYQYSPDDYVFATLSLYLDIINMFRGTGDSCSSFQTRDINENWIHDSGIRFSKGTQ